MDIFKQTFTQFRELFLAMPASQRAMLATVTVLLLGGFGYLMYRGTGNGGYVPVSVGKSFRVEELIRAEETLLQNGYTDFERRGQRLLVPSSKVEEYNAALLAAGSLPQNWAEEWEKQYSDIGPFANNKQMDERKEIARAKLASQMLLALPDIEYANVVWDQEEKARWPKQPRSTATVSVQPRANKQLDETLVHAVRVSIAGMKANLSAEDVTVLDLGRGIAYQQADDNDPFNDRLLQRIQQLKDMYRDEVLTAIDYIDSVRVAVKVDIDKVKSAIRRSQSVETTGTTLVSINESSKHNSNRFQTAKEPGQNANGPMNLAGQQTPTQSADSTETKESSLTAPSFQVTQEDVAGALPENVSVSVVIPEQYYRTVALQSGQVAPDATEEDIRAAVQKVRPDVDDAVKARVAKIIPIPVGQNVDDYIDVGAFIPSPTSETIVSIPWTQTLSYWITQWGSAVGLGIFALWAFWMLNKTVRSQTETEIPEPEPEQVEEAKSEEEEFSDEDLMPQGDTKRVDHLQYLVKKNPEMTASIISNWIQEAK
ncbi:MAG: hypothetical protein ACE37I_02650 [Rubinisphaera brasiliensis]|uniref:Secretory protein YscJ/FliF family protein n=1 Tax=Rubinisphaera brasiliensis (strain ATCC 49424 / DSM 5305 / JCM 21570 / IAM 15109 / NBRC 103401 / IFAM 1448) TaxID=756272 RepID=F0SNY2_RUBBR|nr:MULTISPECIES: secretory protein YscJ/FliF [Rubinisphaera]ADY60058.1 secretory protein YscJ/FliF family protein [Rubinisphaera brasiliensis DSM 5305]